MKSKKNMKEHFDEDAKIALAILSVLVILFIFSAVFSTGNNISGSAVYETGKISINDLLLNPFFIIITFLLVIFGVYSYENNVYVPIPKLCKSVPVNVSPEQRKLEMPKPASKVGKDKKDSSFFSFVLANKSNSVKQKPVKVLTPEQSFDKLVADVSKEIDMPDFNVIRASEKVSREFSRLPLDVQDKKLPKFLSFHKKLEDSVK